MRVQAQLDVDIDLCVLTQVQSSHDNKRPGCTNDAVSLTNHMTLLWLFHWLIKHREWLPLFILDTMQGHR